MLRRFSTISYVIAAACLGFAASGMTAWLGATGLSTVTRAQQDVCVRPEAGSAVIEPAELRSHDGVIETDLSIHDEKLPDGTVRYCYLTPDGRPSPTLRVKPGDQLVIHFRNDLVDTGTPAIDRALATAPICTTKKAVDACNSGAMTPVSTNLHFHGLSVPPVCHQDDVLRTSIQPDDGPFEYRVRIPDDAPPGLYWYHPGIGREMLAQAKRHGGGVDIPGVEGPKSSVQALSLMA